MSKMLLVLMAELIEQNSRMKLSSGLGDDDGLCLALKNYSSLAKLGAYCSECLELKLDR